ncbi:MAG: alpha-hydroxy acid oxidase, partial [Pararhodobacter sp.]
NQRALEAVRLWPRAPRDVSACDTSVEIFGQRLAMPLAVAPIGLANLVWPGMDLRLAQAAAAGGIPYVLSTASTTLIEDSAAQAGALRWFQLYTSTDMAITDDLLARARASGFSVLVVTVDVATPGRRYRDLANGFRLPMPMGPSFWAQIIRCPAWAAAALRAPVPSVVNIERYAPARGAQSLAAFMATQVSASVDLDMIAR